MADTSHDFLLDAREAAHAAGTCDPRECPVCDDEFADEREEGGEA